MTQLKCMGIDCYFWRTKADAEVDFITDYEGTLLCGAYRCIRFSGLRLMWTMRWDGRSASMRTIRYANRGKSFC